MTLKSLASILAIAATAALIVTPADAARRSAKAKRHTDNHARTFYYHGTGTHALYDTAAKHFGSPVRGREFFYAIQNRAGY